jgi:predicted ATP-grasp superfamily ATP-dependent carboligase
VERPVFSRAVRNFWRVPDPDVSPSEFSSALCQLIGEHRHDMLIPANDIALTATTENYDSFSERLHVACPSPLIVRRILNKDLTLETARQCGVRIPHSVTVSNSAALREAVQSLSLPIVLKPAEKRRSDEFKSCIVDNAASLDKLFPAPRVFSPPLLAQEFCPGDGVGVEVLMHNGEAVAVFQHRRLKELPHGGGVAVVAIAESPGAELVRCSIRLLQALHWEGVAMVEFKVNSADGTATLMEVNGRYWGSVSLPLLAGMNFPLYHWKLVHGENPEIPSSYRVGTKWRWTAGCLDRYHGLLLAARRPGPDRDLLLHDLQHFLEDFDSPTGDALFDPSDPMPAIFEILRTAKDLAVSDMRRIVRAVHAAPRQECNPALNLDGKKVTGGADGKVHSRS